MRRIRQLHLPRKSIAAPAAGPIALRSQPTEKPKPGDAGKRCSAWPCGASRAAFQDASSTSAGPLHPPARPNPAAREKRHEFLVVEQILICMAQSMLVAAADSMPKRRGHVPNAGWRLLSWEPIMEELRRAERIRSFLRAQIIFNNRMSTIDCVIKNISTSGAKVALSSSLAVPTEFDIDIPQKGRSHRARLVWRDNDAIGIEFLDVIRPGSGAPPPTATPESRLHNLQLENAELKGKIKSLRKKLEDLGVDPDLIC
jgi:PilZ domain